MNNYRKQTNNEAGFTIIELTISTAVFSMLLLVLFSSIIYVGRTYYRGVTLTRTNDVATSIIGEVSDTIKLTSAIQKRPIADSPGWEAWCVGNTKYSYKLNVLKETAAQEVFVASEDQGCTGTAPTLTNVRELLEQNMRVSEFDIITTPQGLVQIDLVIASGGDNPLDTSANGLFNVTAGKIENCKTGVAGSEFCAVSDLSVVVFRRIN